MTSGGPCSTEATSFRDFIRASDLSPMPERIVELFNDGTEARGNLVFSGGD